MQVEWIMLQGEWLWQKIFEACSTFIILAEKIQFSSYEKKVKSFFLKDNTVKNRTAGIS